MMNLPLPAFKCESSIWPHLEKIFQGEYDIPITPKDPVILDIGANCGAFSIWAKHRFPGCEVRAYEPHPKTFALLKENVASYSYISCFNYGIGYAGFRPLYNGMNNSGEATLFPGNLVSDGTGQHVEIYGPMTLPKADIIKIDTEGAELEILRPLIDGGREFKAIMLEYHRIEDRREIDYLLRDYILTKAEVFAHPALGILCYVHPSELRNL